MFCLTIQSDLMHFLFSETLKNFSHLSTEISLDIHSILSPFADLDIHGHQTKPPLTGSTRHLMRQWPRKQQQGIIWGEFKQMFLLCKPSNNNLCLVHVSDMIVNMFYRFMDITLFNPFLSQDLSKGTRANGQQRSRRQFQTEERARRMINTNHA